MTESDDFKIRTRRIRDGDQIRRIQDGRGQWQMEARVDKGPWRYLLASQKMVGTTSWIVRVKDTETGEVLSEPSPGRPGNKALQLELVRRLQEKARAS
jgi:hypothetical protein